MSAIARTVPRVVPRAASAQLPRAFATTARQHTLKDNLKSVDRKVSDKLVDGIDIGAAVVNKVRHPGSDVSHGKLTGHASELREQAEREARRRAGQAGDELANKARYMAGRASELSDEANDIGGEFAGEMKEKAKDVGGKVKGKAEEMKHKAGA